MGTGNAFTILVLSEAGTAEGAVRRAHTPVRVSRADRERYVEWRISRFRVEDAFTERARQVLSSRVTPYPRTLPAFDRLLADQDGNLWAREYARPWNEGPRSWSVFEPGGAWLGTVQVPGRFEVLEIGRDFLLGIAVEELGVERLRLYRLEKPGASVVSTSASD